MTAQRLALIILTAACAINATAQEEPRTSFRVRYVAADAIYLDAGRDAGLAEGFHLTIKRVKDGDPLFDARPIAEVVVVSIAATSAVCEIQSKTMDLEVGDTALLAANDAELLKMLQASRTSRRYAQVVSFTEGDPIDEEAREYVPKPPLAEINRASGRVAFEYGSVINRTDASSGSRQIGLVLRADMTRMGGSYWSFTGYWRGRLNSHQLSSNQQTLNDLVNRTFQIGFTYMNPQSKYVAGFGRLLLPWASSISTLDGAYGGYRLTKRLTAVGFGGTAPDPSSWNYAPNRQIAGSLLNIELGSFERVKYSGTAGAAITRRNWNSEREFLFLENSFLVGRTVSFFHSLQADHLKLGRFGQSKTGQAISQSFFTARYQPYRRLTMDLNHNYFRGIPTFDTRLLGTGLLDKLLFQGLSAGARIDLTRRLTVYFNLGRNKRESESQAAWNQMYGGTLANIFNTGGRFDLRFSRYTSSFGSGEYYSATYLRDITDHLRIEVQAGRQTFSSAGAAVTQQNRAMFLSTNLDWFLGTHYWFGFGHTLYQGELQKYDQIFSTFGYRF